MTSEAVELLRALIRNACVNDGTPDGGHEHRSVATLQSFLGEPGHVWEPHPGRQSVLFRLPGADPTAPRFMLMGHLDVVPVNPAGWTRDPFAAEIDDGFVWGRGAVDMLNVTAAMAAAFARHRRGDLPPPRGDLLFLAVADEENGGSLGAGHITESDWPLVACEYALTEIAYPAVATPHGPAATISVGEKGPLWQDLAAGGVPGHASQPYHTDSALVRTARAIAAIAGAPMPVEISEEWRRFAEQLDLPDDLRAGLVDPERVDDAIERLAETDLGMARYAHACTHLTISPTILTSGEKANTIPDRAAGTLDMRLLPGQDETTAHDHLAKVLGGDYERLGFVTKMQSPANASPAQGALWSALVNAHRTLSGSDRVVPAITPATTDARFWRERGTVVYGAGWFDERVSFSDFLAMFHGNDERISVESVDRTTRLLEETVVGFSETARHERRR